MTMVPENTALQESLADTLARWSSESADLEKQGAYDWLCGRLDSGVTRVLEIGCGFGDSTLALSRHGYSVFVLDNRMACLEATRDRVPSAQYGLVDVAQIPELLLNDLNDFAPQAMVLWLAGAPADSLPAHVPAHVAVMQYRLAVQNAAVTLAAHVSSITSVHLADRTAFPWQMKHAGRETMAQLIQSAVINTLPFSLTAADVQFRKLTLPSNLGRHAAPGGLTAVLGDARLLRL